MATASGSFSKLPRDRRREGHQRDHREQHQVDDREEPGRAGEIAEHVAVPVPEEADHGEPEEVGADVRPELGESGTKRVRVDLWDLDGEHEQGDRDREDAVAERVEAFELAPVVRVGWRRRHDPRKQGRSDVEPIRDRPAGY